MRKSMIKLFLFLLMCICLTGCKKVNNVSTPIELPEMLSVNFDIYSVISPEQASIYNAELYDADADLLLDLLMKGEKITENENSSGKSFISENDINGKHLFIENGSIGYYVSCDTVSYTHLIELTPGPISLTAQRFPYMKKSDYTLSELSFLTAEEATKTAIDLASACAPELIFTVSEKYCLDSSAMQNHFDIYMEKNSPYFDEEEIEKLNSQELPAESYVMFLNQEVDGIPIHNENRYVMLAGSGRSEITLEGTSGYSIIDSSGITEFYIEGAYLPTSKDEPASLISANQALAAIAEEYQEVYLTTPIIIQGCQLCYAAFPGEGEDLYLLKPTWVFILSEERSTIQADDGTNVILSNYKLVDAITGECVE